MLFRLFSRKGFRSFFLSMPLELQRVFRATLNDSLDRSATRFDLSIVPVTATCKVFRIEREW
jgi:hypothetical protein